MQLTIITDDLTGAADSGSYFTERGQQLHIFTGEPIHFFRQKDEIISINLSSRNVKGEEAKHRHFNACTQLKSVPGQIFMKKIGTGFRGNDAFELEGMLTAMPDYLCFIIDNAPDLGTFTLYGHQYCEGEILPKSLYAKDPILPPTKSFIPEILKQDTDLPIGLVDIDAVKGGGLLKETARLVQNGCRIIVFDAITKRDTELIIETLFPIYQKVFWTGSLGIADGLAQYLYGDKKSTILPKREIRSICFCASAYDMAKKQILHSQSQGLQVVELDMDKVIDGDESEYERAIDQMLAENRTNNALLVPKTVKYSYQPGTSVAIMRAIELCASSICKKAIFDRLVVIGGETAQAIFRTVGIHSVALGKMPEAGVAQGIIQDGALAKKEFALKGGSVGSTYALEKMLCNFQETGEL